MVVPKRVLDTEPNPLLAAALSYASRGWHVLPLTPAGKIPLGKLVQKGFLNATTDAGIIRAWWGRFRRANVGIRAGSVSGLVVLDVDPRHGGGESLAQFQRQYGALPPTAEVLTGGGGRHLYFAHPDEGLEVSSTAGLNGLPGLDLRGDKGYVVAPPSLHSSGARYKWREGASVEDLPLAPMPGFFLDLFRSSEERTSKQIVPIPGDGEPILEGTRHSVLVSLAGSMRNRGMRPQEINPALQTVNEGRCRPPLSSKEVAIIASSMAQYHCGRLLAIGSSALTMTPKAPTWPGPPEEEAFYGLSGEIVRTLEPHSEADPAALLIQTLTAFGNTIGRSAHFRVEADTHYLNLFIVLVGVTSKGRKGSSWGQVLRLFTEVDSE